jgi:hypothetical protein
MNVQLFDDRGRTAKIHAAARREVLMIGAASYRRYHDVKSLDIDQPDTMAKKKQIRPTALHQKAPSRADRWKVRRRVATQSQSRGNKAGPGKVGEAIMVDLDLTGEDLLEQRLNVAVTIRPKGVDIAAPTYTEQEKHETPNNQPQTLLWWRRRWS